MIVADAVQILDGVVHILSVKGREDEELKVLADAVQSVLQAILTDIVCPAGQTN